MEPEDLETRLCVRVVRGFVLDLSNADLGVEFLHDTQEVAQTDVSVGNETLDLMELSQMGRVQSLVTEDTVD